MRRSIVIGLLMELFQKLLLFHVSNNMDKSSLKIPTLRHIRGPLLLLT